MINWAFEKCELLIEAGCKALSKILSLRLITTNGDPYLSRHYLLRRKWFLPVDDDAGIDVVTGTWRDYIPGIYLHYFHRGDQDRELHNHPWANSFSLVLTNGYMEERWTPRGIVKREVRPGSINIIRANDFHRVDLRDPSKGCWTIFFTGRRAQNWGFWNPRIPNQSFIPWQDYVDSRDKEDDRQAS